LVPLVARPEGMSVLLTQRTAHLNDHAGQISFPGGRCEASDASHVHTALRETEEETGLILPLASGAGADFSHLTLIARAITPTESPIRFHARFFQADAALTEGKMEATPELADLAYRPLAEALKLPMFDITEAVVRHVQIPTAGEPAFLFTYRNGGAKRTGLR
jgi:8-oxo-dGTP pyrophosphatase MutT (NUDIX family)